MPNHVTNIMTITGPEEDVERLRKTLSVTENPTLLAHLIEVANQDIQKYTAAIAKYPSEPWRQVDLLRAQDTLKHLQGGNGSALNFEGSVPMPLSLHGTTSGAVPEEEKDLQAENLRLYGHADWHEWSIDKWSTKWNAYTILVEDNKPGLLTYRFNTAWSPPKNWIWNTAAIFPTLEIEDRWISEGGSAGTIMCQGGCLNEDSMEEHDWRMEYDSGYREEYDWLTEGDYQRVINQYSEEGSIERYDFEQYLLDRIRPEDLLLFINFEWQNETVEEAFKQRLQENPKPAKKTRSKKVSIPT